MKSRLPKPRINVKDRSVIHADLPRPTSELARRFDLTRLSASLYYVFQAALLALVLIYQFELLDRNLDIAVNSTGDTIYNLTIAKAIARDGWWWHVRSLAAPIGTNLAAMPILGNLDCLIMRLIAVFTQKAGLLLNVYWFGTIIAAGPISAWCLRQLGARPAIALVLGILYALSPHVYYRHTAHLMLTHHLLPLAATLAILLAAGRIQSLTRKTLYGLLAGSILVGFSYTYYAFFSCFVLLIGGLVGFLGRRDYQTLRVAGLAVGLVIAATVVNLAPSIYSWIVEPGGRRVISFKSVSDADLYGLKIRQMITPTTQSAIPMLATISAKVKAVNFPQDNNESSLSRLGAVASAGFLLLVAIGALWTAPARTPAMGLLKAIGALVMACVLLGTVGGFGSIFNLIVRPDIRAYNRIAIFIGFFSFAAVAVVLTQVLSLLPDKRWVARGKAVGLALLLLIGIADQNEAHILNATRMRDQHNFQVQSDFVQRIEQAMPHDAMIYQLPHLAYTDGDGSATPRNPRVAPSDPHFPFLFANSVRWSYPAVSADAIAFARRVGRLEPDAPNLVDTIRGRGFLGIYIDRLGYADDGVNLIRSVGEYIRQAPMQSNDGRYTFFGLSNLARKDQTEIDRYVWGSPIMFSPPIGGGRYLSDGWSCVGCTEGKTATMKFFAPSPPSDITLKARLEPALFGGVSERTVRVFVNEIAVGEWKVRQPDWYSLSLRRNILEKSPHFSLRFELPDATSPKDLGLNLDARTLSVVFQQMVMRPQTEWRVGAYGEESNSLIAWRWCSAECEVDLFNTSATPARVQVQMGITTGYQKPAKFTIIGPSMSHSESVNASTRQLKYVFDLPPGRQTLKMSSDSKRLPASTDPRNLVFMVTNFSVTSAAPEQRQVSK